MNERLVAMAEGPLGMRARCRARGGGSGLRVRERREPLCRMPSANAAARKTDPDPPR
jgi:hypothetical protein